MGSSNASFSYPDLPGKLSRLISFPTVSSFVPAEEDEAAFRALKESLPLLYPRVCKAMKQQELSDRSLLFIWQGSEPALSPVILCAHFDVVPAPSPAAWEHGPFSGEIADGAVWGRGAQDVKVLMAAMLEAAEKLVESGFKPRRSIYFAFGGDEEVGGQRGAAAIAAHFAAKGIRASFLVDEGGPIAVGMLAFAQRPLALVGVAEKGYADFRIFTKGSGGHASMPPRRTAPGDLARSIAAIEARPFPARLTRSVRAFFDRLAPESKQPYRFLFQQLWLTAPFIKIAFSASPTTNALIRTTVACTMLQGSPKENVLADSAEATLNVRMLPGESSQEAADRLKSIVARFGADLAAKHEGHIVEASAESSTDHEGWRAVEAALRASHPEAACIPFLFSAATDTKHYRHVAEAIYRFSPLPQSPEDLKSIHGDNEKVRLEDLERCALFYKNLMQSL